MHQNQRIKLYQQRHFSDKINVTFAFLRENAWPYFKAQIFIAGPVAILTTLMYTLLLSTMFSQMNQADPNFVFSASYFTNLTVASLLSLLLVVAVGVVHFSYLKLYQQRTTGRPDVNEVWQLVKKKIAPAVGLYIMVGILVFLGFMLLIIPGIYLAVVFSLAVPVLIIDDKGVFASIGRSFDLIKGKWWSTFGLLFVTAIIGSIISSLISMPATLIMFAQMLLSAEGNAAGVQPHVAPWALALMALLSYAGTIVSSAVILTAVGFQYYSLVEMKESRGLMQEIEKVGEEPTRNVANEGEY